MGVSTSHIDEYPQEQLKGLCKQYYKRARKAEENLKTSENSVKSLQQEINKLRSVLMDIQSLAEGA